MGNDQLILSKLDDLRADIARLEEKFDDYVTKDRFEPVKVLVYGGVGFLLCTVGFALLALIVKGFR